MKKPSFKDVLPEYPATRHLPWKPNSKGDKIATWQEAAIIFECDQVCVQEKIDGANCGMSYLNGHPVVRNRTKILRKGQEMKNPSLAQFSSAWNWMHQNKAMFDALEEHGPYSVYGEWMVQQHGMEYNALPDWFVAFDVYDWEKGFYIDPLTADNVLQACGFKVIPISFFGDPKLNKPLTYEFLETVTECPSWFSVGQKREGIIVKASDGIRTIAKFKMVRQGFEQGCLLGDEIKRNKKV